MCITPERNTPLMQRQSGLSLIELIIAIVILSVGLVALLIPISNAVRNSADPLIMKQMVAIAEAMLEEIELQPYATPTGSTCNPCAATQANRVNFDHIANYNTFATTGIYRIDDPAAGPGIATLASYNLSVAATPTTLGGVPAFLISVTVTWPNTIPGVLGKSVTVSAYRTNYY